MTDQIVDYSVAGTAEDNIPTMSNPMDNIHGTTEDISNKASGYKVSHPTPPKLTPQLSQTSSNTPFQATISNPNTKDSTKKNAKEMFEQLGGEDAFMKNNGKGE